jgi:hypothetical protein
MSYLSSDSSAVTGSYQESFDKFNGQFIWDNKDGSSFIFWDSSNAKWCVAGSNKRAEFVNLKNGSYK